MTMLKSLHVAGQETRNNFNSLTVLFYQKIYYCFVHRLSINTPWQTQPCAKKAYRCKYRCLPLVLHPTECTGW